MTPDKLTWKPIADHPDEFYDGDKYLLAIEIKNKDKDYYDWEFVTVFVSCDEDYFELKQDINGVIESYSDWHFDDFSYYIKY